MKRNFVKKPIHAETDAEMTQRHIREEMSRLINMRDQIKNLADSIEDVQEVTYDTMELGTLYQACLDTLQAWSANYYRVYTDYTNGANLEN